MLYRPETSGDWYVVFPDQTLHLATVTDAKATRQSDTLACRTYCPLLWPMESTAAGSLLLRIFWIWLW